MSAILHDLADFSALDWYGWWGAGQSSNLEIGLTKQTYQEIQQFTLCFKQISQDRIDNGLSLEMFLANLKKYGSWR